MRKSFWELLVKDTLNKSLDFYKSSEGPFIGKRGGKWADPEHTIPWKNKDVVPGSKEHVQSLVGHLRDHHNVKLDAYQNGDVVTLSRVVVPPESRNQGVGTDVMDSLHRYADRYGKTVALTPSEDFGGKKSKLEKFYGGMGYKKNKGRAKDFTISEAMYREAKNVKKGGFCTQLLTTKGFKVEILK